MGKHAAVLVTRVRRRLLRTQLGGRRAFARERGGRGRVDIYQLAVLVAYGVLNEGEMRDGREMLCDVKKRDERQQAPEDGAPTKARAESFTQIHVRNRRLR